MSAAPGGYPYPVGRAVAAIAAADPALGRIIDAVGPFAMQRRRLRSPFDALLRAIVYQQISGHAAAAIHRRVDALFPGRRRPTPRALLALGDDRLRDAGLSRGKIAAARDLAGRCLDGTVPGGKALAAMRDDEIVERLVAVRGIGRWSVEMLLMFELGRPDVLPATDLGVRKGYGRARGGADLPSAAEVLDAGERWRPWRSVAAWYLWRAAELPADGAKGTGNRAG